ncbi:amino acid adenylation domain-containing protein [Paenibacillus aurantiacus]|uniref:Amino acid adenylation domain-containing protein n=1 Tax=Paenibacillus aurantiacus TaxID=1936118 RepID=A0ABV5KVG0_9BACL
MNAESTKLDKSNVEDILGLTPLQEGLLYHAMTGDDRHYAQHLTLRLSGDLSLQAIEQAWSHVIAANEMLRTVFRWGGLERPVQLVLKKIAVPIKMQDYGDETPRDGERLSGDFLDRQRELPFDLRTRPFRIAVCKRSGQAGDMLVSWHHILYDGWSNGVIMHEFLEAYETLQAGGRLAWRSKTGFKQFLKWRLAQSKDQQQTYWRQALSGFEARTPLPAETRAERSATSTATGRYVIAMDQSDTNRLYACARALQLQPAVLFYGAWGIVLGRYSRSVDVLFGTTVSGRVPDIHGVEEMVGLFINTVPLRMNIDPDATVSEWLHALAGQLREREAFEQAPLPDITACSGLGAGQPLFDSIVVVENYPLQLNMGGSGAIRIESYEMQENTHYGLTLGIAMFNGIEIELAYDPSRYADEWAARLAAQYRFVIDQLITRPGGLLRDIGLMPDGQREQILTEFNALRRSVGERADLPADIEAGYIPAPKPDETPFHVLFERQAERRPDEVALVHEGRAFTYRELNERANRLAWRLREMGVQPEHVVAILLARSERFLIAVLAVLKSGAAYVPIDHEYAPSRVAYMLKDSGSILLITDDAATGAAFECDAIRIDDERSFSQQVMNPDSVTLPGHSAFVLYTSGSTGNPKGVVLEHGNLIAYIEAFQQEFGLTPEDVYLQQSSCAFDQFVEEVFPVLAAGGRVVMAQRMDVLDTSGLVQLIEQEGITFVSASALLLNELNKLGGMRKVRVFISGGDVMKPSYISNLKQHAAVYNTYGPTETTVCATYYRYEGEEDGPVPIGKPIQHYRVYVVDEAGHLAPVGAPGEICIAGAGVARGYLNQTELNGERFVKDPFAAGERMYRTGDVGSWLPDGNLLFLGRNDNQLKIRGYRIEPGEVEHHLQDHPDVEEAIIMPIETSSGQKSLAAYVKLTASLTAGELRAHLAERLPAPIIPSIYYRIEGVPRTANGKTDKEALRRLAQPLTVSESAFRMASDTESTVRDLWQQVLGADSIGLDEPFMESGGDSIQLMQLHAKLEKTFGGGMRITDLFTHATIAKQAAWIDDHRQDITRTEPLLRQRLPAAYFGRSPQANGSSLIRFQLQGASREGLTRLASASGVSRYDILIGALTYLLGEASGQNCAMLYSMTEDERFACPITVDLNGMTAFEQLYVIVSQQRGCLDQTSVPIEELPKRAGHPAGEAALILASPIPLRGRAAGLQGVVDALLVLEDDDSDERIAGSFTFNDRRLLHGRMSLFMKSYLVLIQQLCQEKVRS